MLRTLPRGQKTTWPEHLNKVVHAYNYTKNDVTEFFPFFLFDLSPRLPIDITFELGEPQKSEGYSNYAKQWAEAMKQAYEIVTEKMKTQNDSTKKKETKKTYSSILKPGDPGPCGTWQVKGSLGKYNLYSRGVERGG